MKMSEQNKRYTAQEMREVLNKSWHDLDRETVHDMIRQAADTEDELAKVKASKERWMQYQETAAGERNACIDELRKKDEEIAHLKKQLEAHESKTKRNCDRFDDAHNAWIAWQTEHCANGGHDRFPKWLFSPCEEGGAK